MSSEEDCTLRDERERKVRELRRLHKEVTLGLPPHTRSRDPAHQQEGRDRIQTGQPYGEEAYRALERKVLGKKVKVQIIDIDHYRRMVVVLCLGDADINCCRPWCPAKDWVIHLECKSV